MTTQYVEALERQITQLEEAVGRLITKLEDVKISALKDVRYRERERTALIQGITRAEAAYTAYTAKCPYCGTDDCIHSLPYAAERPAPRVGVGRQTCPYCGTDDQEPYP